MASNDDDDDKALIKASIQQKQHRGVKFYDVNSLLSHPKAFKTTIDALVSRYESRNIDMIAALEARGFLFAGPLALALNVPWTMLRKPGKLPGECTSIDYGTEYSKDTLQCQKDSIVAGSRVLILDDLMATGGTALAAKNLIERCGAYVDEVCCIMEIVELQGKEKLCDTNFFSLLQY